jgi:hypothetical protein
MPRRPLRIPYLFDRERRAMAFRLYELVAARLVFAGRNQEAVAAVRRVRAHVRRAGLGHLGLQYSLLPVPRRIGP